MNSTSTEPLQPPSEDAPRQEPDAPVASESGDPVLLANIFHDPRYRETAVACVTQAFIQYAEPLTDAAANDQEILLNLRLAALLWNCAGARPEARKGLEEELVALLAGEAPDPDVYASSLNMVQMMLKRREQFLPHAPFVIHDCSLFRDKKGRVSVGVQMGLTSGQTASDAEHAAQPVGPAPRDGC